MESNLDYISCEDYKENSGDWTVIDVRTQEEWKEGHIEGAKHIPLSVLEIKAEEKLPDKSQKLVMCCKKGGRGAQGAEILMDLGYENVKVLEGGYDKYCGLGSTD